MTGLCIKLSLLIKCVLLYANCLRKDPTLCGYLPILTSGMGTSDLKSTYQRIGPEEGKAMVAGHRED